MDNTAQISDLIDSLDDNLTNLQTALKTIINKSLTDVASGYPVLDRAKLYILVTYAIESAVFTFLRMSGTSAREHPVFRELERVKQYFQKAKLAELTLDKPAMRLDQAAAGRFIKAALAGNEALKPKAASEPNTEPPRVTTPDLDKSKKRKLEAVSLNTSESPMAKQVSDSSDGDNDDDDEHKTGPTKSSKAVSQITTPAKSGSKSSLTGNVSTTETDASKGLSKKALKKLRKAENKMKKDASQVDTATSELDSIEPQPKKLKTSGDNKKEKKKRKKSKDGKSAG